MEEERCTMYPAMDTKKIEDETVPDGGWARSTFSRFFVALREHTSTTSFLGAKHRASPPLRRSRKWRHVEEQESY
jgi:hypothetical protein